MHDSNHNTSSIILLDPSVFLYSFHAITRYY